MRTLETDRLILRDWAINDVEDAYVFWSNPNCTIPEGSIPMKCIDETYYVHELQEFWRDRL